MNTFLTYLKENQQMIPIYTGILGFIGVMLSSILKSIFDFFINKKKIKSEVVSKSRVEWIQEVRKSMSEYLSYGGKLCTIHRKIMFAKNDEIEELIEEFDNNFSNLLEKQNLLILYFPQLSYKGGKEIENVEHTELIDKMNYLSKRLQELSQDIELQIKYNVLFEINRNHAIDALSDFTFEASQYLKKEWEKAKKIK